MSEYQKAWEIALELQIEIYNLKSKLAYKEHLLREAIQTAELLKPKEKDDALKKGQ